MKHYYKDITGWCDFESIYSRWIAEAKDGDIIIETGTANGQSTAYLAVEAANSGKLIRIITCDIFEAPGQFEYAISHLSDFKNVEVLRRNSLEVLADFVNDPAVNYIFLDDNHSEEHVRKQINYILQSFPYLIELAGHDYTNAGSPGVRKAVDALLPNVKIEGTSFIHKI